MFNALDADQSGEISLAELRRGLNKLTQPSATDRFAAKRKAEMAAKARRKARSKVAVEAELKERLSKAKQSGAFEVPALPLQPQPA